MKRLKLIILFLTISSSCFSQDIVQTINWKAGDSKLISLRLNAKEMKNGITTTDTTVTVKSEFFVKEVTDDRYRIHIKTENKQVALGSTFYDGLSDELTDNNNLDRDIEIRIDSMSSKVLNKKEYHSSLGKTHDEILAVLQDKVPEKVEAATVQLNELLAALQESDEALRTLDLILSSYDIRYSEADTLITMDSIANPFQLKNFNGAKVKTFMATTENRDTFNIVVEKEYDFEAYKELVSNFSNQVTEPVGEMVGEENKSNGVDQISEVSKTLFNSFEFDASESLTVTRKLNSNWPVRLFQETALEVRNAEDESVTMIDIVIDIK